MGFIEFFKPGCPLCSKAKQVLLERDIQYEEIILRQDVTTASLRAVTNRAIRIADIYQRESIGDSDNLKQRLQNA